MKKRLFFTLILLFLLFSTVAAALAATPGPVHQAHAVVLADGNTGDILYARNAHERIHPASTTKIMTALLAVEAMERGEFAIGDLLTTTETALADMIPAGAAIGLEVGEEMSFESLVYAVMLISANDASNVLAEYIGGSVNGFVQMMNERARNLGALNTNFTNAHGLTEDNHFTTAYDMFRISFAAMNNARFMEIATALDQPHPSTNVRPAGIFNTTNLMADPDSPHYYPGLFGIKTGYTHAAGFCFVSAAAREELFFIAVVMGVSPGEAPDPDGPTHFTETAIIYDWAFDTFEYVEILSMTEEVTRVPVSLGDGADSVGLRPSSPLSALTRQGEVRDIRHEITLFIGTGEDGLVAPVNQGEILGEITLHYGDRSFGPINLVAAETVRLSQREYILGELESTLENPLVRIAIGALLLLFFLYIIYAIVHAIVRRKRRKARLRRR